MWALMLTNKVRRPKHSMEEWCTLTHDVELAVHPETPLFKDGQVPNETELSQILWLRRMERQPELAAQLDEIAKWLHALLLKKGEKDIRGIVRAINNCCNKWFEVAGLSTRTGTALWQLSCSPSLWQTL